MLSTRRGTGKTEVSDLPKVTGLCFVRAFAASRTRTNRWSRSDAEFDDYRGQLVLIRPDRFIAATWLPGAPSDLAATLAAADPALVDA